MAKTKAKKADTRKTTAQQLGSLIKSARDIMRKDKGLNGDLDRLPLLTWIMFLKFLDDREKLGEAESSIAGKRYKPAVDTPYRCSCNSSCVGLKNHGPAATVSAERL